MKIAVLGVLDEQDWIKASLMGINLRGGYIRNTDGRVVIGNRFFLTMGMRHRYVMRSRIVWWLRTGEFLVGGEWDIHHKNGNRIDDRFSNLEKLSHLEHTAEHNPPNQTLRNCVCQNCGKTFQLPQWRINMGRGKACSHSCGTYLRWKKEKA